MQIKSRDDCCKQTKGQTRDVFSFVRFKTGLVVCLGLNNGAIRRLKSTRGACYLVLTFEFIKKILRYDDSNETPLAVLLHNIESVRGGHVGGVNNKNIFA